jgi:hypothetical protein
VGYEIQLSGGEITILKAIGLTGTALGGKFLLDKMEEVEAGEFIDTLAGMLAMGYLLSTKVSIRTLEDPAILSRPLFRSLGLVLRTDAAAGSQNRRAR